jgi:hypothetical protein
MTHNEAVADVGAVAAVVSPVWLPMLHEVSDFAALALPILGAVWLMVQIITKLWTFYKGRRL